MIKINKIYRLLFKYYGHQGWWPVTSGNKISIYHPGDYSYPRTSLQAQEIIIGSILTQNTSWNNVYKAIVNLKSADLLSFNGILKAGSRIKKYIKCSGYYNQKTLKLVRAADFFTRNKIKDLSKMDKLKLRQILLGVNGIGPETADSIILYAFKKPVFVIDAYTKRLFSRLGFPNTENYELLQKLIMDEIHADFALYGEFHALIVIHAKSFCRKNPVCGGCPLAGQCPFKR